MRSDGGRPGQLERPALTARLAGPALAITAFILLMGAGAPPAPATGSGARFIDGPTPGGGAGSGGGGGDLLAGLGPLLLVGLAIAVVVAGAAAVILFRTRGGPVTSPSEGWWTCSSCGAGNMDGAARCHACATWRTTNPRPTPSASP